MKLKIAILLSITFLALDSYCQINTISFILQKKIIFEINASDMNTCKEQVRGELLALNRPLYSGTYRNYLLKLKPNNKFKKAYIFNNELTTVSAKEYWQNYFKNNFKKFENDSIAIVFISSSRNKTILDFNLTKKYKNVFIDDQFIYNDFIGPVVHCQYVDLRTDNMDIEICDAPHSYMIADRLEIYRKTKKTKSPFKY